MKQRQSIIPPSAAERANNNLHVKINTINGQQLWLKLE